jgi:molybdopterin synthase sulfur carrier subunit
MSMKLVYFAWVRERIGKTGEGIVRAAVDHVHVRPDASIIEAREVAFFPPMTGG